MLNFHWVGVIMNDPAIKRRQKVKEWGSGGHNEVKHAISDVQSVA